MHTPIQLLKQLQALPEAAWWLPACCVPQVDIAQATVLGLDLVLWRTSTGWQAAPNQCPHRGAKLSDGCVQNEHLQCPYHGWQFNTQGACTLIPATPDFKPLQTHGIETVAVLEYAGLLWVQLAPNSTTPLPSELYPSHTTAQQAKNALSVLVGPYDVNTSAPRAVENFLDVSHFGTVHAGWLGDAAHMEVPPYVVNIEPNRATATGVRTWQPKSQATLNTGAWVDYTYRVAHPYCAELSKQPDITAGFAESIAVWSVPLTPDTCRVWFSLCMENVGQTAADIQTFHTQDFQHTIFMQDKPILEGQRPALLPLNASAEKHSAADRMSAAYRQLLRDWGIGYGTIL